MKKISKNKLRLRRKRRVSSKIRGTAKIPRLSVFRSLRAISVQVINDEDSKTFASSNSKEFSSKDGIEGAKKVGEDIAKKCAKQKISQVVFDRGGYKYHGKVKALAEEARKGGLKF